MCSAPNSSFKENTPKNAKEFQKEHQLQFPVGHDSPLDTSSILSSELEALASTPKSSELPSAMMMTLGAKGTPWSVMMAPAKDGKMRLLFNDFRFPSLEHFQMLVREGLQHTSS
mmetsp:Transcript_9597/g.13284  ORF Transcript_9597/g.13284 Transcript_9597/m.13284 type:complete len:114 (+) Transcript_9597:482-823(+)